MNDVPPPARSTLSRVGILTAVVTTLATTACDNRASELSAGPETVALRGTASTFLELEANGGWVASTEPSWLSVEPSAGEGDETLTVTVDRDGLDVAPHAGIIMVAGDSDTSVTVPVLVQFPQIDGRVHSPGGNLQPRLREGRSTKLRPGVDYVAGEILVGLDKQLIAIQEHGITSGPLEPDLAPSAQALQLAAQQLGARVGATTSTITSPTLGLAKLQVATPDVAAAIADIRRDGRARYAEPNQLMQLHEADDTHYDLQWHYQRINLEQAWAVTTGYQETVVAVLDADFHPDHPDLAGSLLPGYDFRNDSEDILTLNPACGAHGTHVAGTIAAVTNNATGVAGVAPDVRILPLNLALNHGDADDDPDDADCRLDAETSARAIMYAAGAADSQAGQLERPVDVINMSFGGAAPSDARAEALEFALDAGVVLVSSAGNGGREDKPVSYPAARPMVAAIAATGPTDERAPYSTAGPEVWVTAPGGDSSQTIPGTEFSARTLSTEFVYPQLNQEFVEVIDDFGHAYGLKQGTSMSSPHVAGVAALIRSVNPDLSPRDVLEILAQTATDLGEPGRDEEHGFGLIDAEAAVIVARDNLRVPTDAVVVRLLDREGEVLFQTEVDTGGAFELGTLAAGEYTLVAGSLRDDNLDVPGTVYGEKTLTIDYSGNRTLRLPVDAR